jgi:hypothetical protein
MESDGLFRCAGIVERLKLAGCAVDDKGSEWRRTRRFRGLDAYSRQAPADRRRTRSRDWVGPGDTNRVIGVAGADQRTG